MADAPLILDSSFKADFRYEEIQFFFRRHWTRFFKIICIGLLIGLLAFFVLLGLYALTRVLNFYAMRIFFVFSTLITSFLFLTLFAIEIISYYFDLVIVTDHRIVFVRKTVFLKNDSGAIDLTKIQDFTVECRGILQNYLRYGNLVITLSSSTPPIVVDCVPYPHSHLERANRVKREHILKRQERRMQSPDRKETAGKNSEYLQDIRELLRNPVS